MLTMRTESYINQAGSKRMQDIFENIADFFYFWFNICETVYKLAYGSIFDKFRELEFTIVKMF